MNDLKQFEKQIKGLREAYQRIFNSDDGKIIISDLEKRIDLFNIT